MGSLACRNQRNYVRFGIDFQWKSPCTSNAGKGFKLWNCLFCNTNMVDNQVFTTKISFQLDRSINYVYQLTTTKILSSFFSSKFSTHHVELYDSDPLVCRTSLCPDQKKRCPDLSQMLQNLTVSCPDLSQMLQNLIVS